MCFKTNVYKYNALYKITYNNINIGLEKDDFMKIVVLCGGTSTERYVSLVTGREVCKALRSKGHQAVLIDVFVGHEGLDINNAFDRDFVVENELEYIKETAKDLEGLKKSRKEFFGPNVLDLCKAADCVFMGLHGACGEDGKVQATFDLLGIKYTGADYLESAMAMDKAVSRKIFHSDNVPMAKGYRINKKDETIYPADMELKYPVVVKPNCGGSSIGVYFANNDAEYKDALEKAFEYEDTLIVEERIIGREFSVGVIGYKPYPVIEIITGEGEAYDYANKYNGTTLEVCPANVEESISKKMQEAAVKAARALGLNTYCRVDVLLDKEGNCYCLEANTLPGMTPTSLLPQEAKAMGIDYPELCELLIDVSIK